VKPRYVDCRNESFWERKFRVTFAPGNESSRERKFHGAKVRGNESSIIQVGYQTEKIASKRTKQWTDEQ